MVQAVVTNSRKRPLSHDADSDVAHRRSPALPRPEAPDQDSPEQSGQVKPAESAKQEEQEEHAVDAKTFQDLGVVEPLCAACAALGYLAPTPIQARAIPHALAGRDIIGLAETGSGKTAAFALPILQALLQQPLPLFGLVLAPTRELAVQIGQAFEALGAMISLRCAVVVGGLDMVQQAIALSKKPHIVVATPGRLVDHLEKTKGFSLRNVKYLVMDEADRLLDMDFGPAIDRLLKFIPRERRTMLFSATMSSKVDGLQRASLRDPVKVSVSSSNFQTVSTLLQSYIFIPQFHKDTYLVWLANEFTGKSIIIFSRTIIETQRLAILLRTLGFGCIPLHGNLNQAARLGALNKFRAGTREILVATDVAARGLDIPKVDLVINYDVPQDSKTYIHRVGRTARAGKSGRAINIVSQYEHEYYARIEAALGKELPMFPTDKEEVMTFRTRVEEAQRYARNELRNMNDSRDKRGGIRSKRALKSGRDDMDVDDDRK